MHGKHRTHIIQKDAWNMHQHDSSSKILQIYLLSIMSDGDTWTFMRSQQKLPKRKATLRSAEALRTVCKYHSLLTTSLVLSFYRTYTTARSNIWAIYYKSLTWIFSGSRIPLLFFLPFGGFIQPAETGRYKLLRYNLVSSTRSFKVTWIDSLVGCFHKLGVPQMDGL